MKIYILLALSFTLLASCERYIKKREYNFKKVKTYCEIPQKGDRYFNGYPEVTKVFESFIKKQKLSFIDKAVLWSLFQTSVRPDISSVTARSQIHLHYNNQNYYFSLGGYENDREEFNQFRILEFLLKKFKSKHSLRQLILKLDRGLPSNIPVSNKLSEILFKNVEKLKKNDTLISHYSKGDQLLKSGETLKRSKLSSIYKEDRKPRNIHDFLFPYKLKNNKTEILCNVDLNLYKNSIYLISHKNNFKSHPYSFVDHKGNYLLAANSQEPDYSQSIKGTNYFGNSGYPAPLAMCFFENSEVKLSLLSSEGRDPAQHLHHLIQYGIHGSKTVQEFNQYIQFPRYVFLVNPKRMLYESHKASEDQLQNFLTIDFPIYHVNAIGNIWGVSHIDKQSELIIDHRMKVDMSCTK